MAQVVVLGGSFGGLHGALRLRKLLPKSHRIVLVNNSERFVFRPSLPWVVFGHRRPHEITADVRRTLQHKGVEFRLDTVKGIDPKQCTVHTAGGPLEYDYLLVALGARLNWQEAPGLQEHGHSVLWLDDAVKTAKALTRFDGGDIVIGAVEGSSLLCPAYEMVLQMDAYLRRRRIRGRSSIHFVTDERRPFFTAGEKAADVVEAMFRKYDIAFHTRTTPMAVEPKRVILDNGTELTSNFTLFIPSYVGTDAIRAANGLADQQGFIPAGKDMRSTANDNIFVAGDAVAFAGPKSGRMAELQAGVAADNIAAEVLGRKATYQYESELLCLSDLGHGKGLLVLAKPAPKQGEPNTILTLPGPIPHWMKLLFERYYLAFRV